MPLPFDTLSHRALLQVSTAATAGLGLAATDSASRADAQILGQQKSQFSSVKALVFDVSGTVVDWRTSVALQAEELTKRNGPSVSRSRARLANLHAWDVRGIAIAGAVATCATGRAERVGLVGGQ